MSPRAMAWSCSGTGTFTTSSLPSRLCLGRKKKRKKNSLPLPGCTATFFPTRSAGLLISFVAARPPMVPEYHGRATPTILPRLDAAIRPASSLTAPTSICPAMTASNPPTPVSKVLYSTRIPYFRPKSFSAISTHSAWLMSMPIPSRIVFVWAPAARWPTGIPTTSATITTSPQSLPVSFQVMFVPSPPGPPCV